MTFYEAAIEVLKSAARPLHYKKITEIAIKKKLLSHVGKTPEVTMGARLVQEIQSASENSDIIRTRPGVYALKAWMESSSSVLENYGFMPLDPKSLPAEELLSSAHLYDGSTSAETADSDPGEGEEPRRRRRRRRRRRGEGEEGEGSDEFTDDGEDSDGEGGFEAPVSALVTGLVPIAEVSATPEEAPRDNSQAERRSFQVVETSRAAKPAETEEIAARRPVGRLSVERFEAILRENNEPMSLEQLSRATDVDGATLKSHMRMENQRNAAQGQRPRFLEVEGKLWTLTELVLDSTTLELERKLQQSVSALHNHIDEGFVEALSELDAAGWERVIRILFGQFGYTLGESQVVGESVVLKAEPPATLTPSSVALKLCHKAMLEVEDVSQLRGTLHHYGCHSGMVISTGKVSREAIAEAAVENLPAITLIDRQWIAQKMLKLGLGTRACFIPTYYIDFSFFDALK